MCIVWRAFIDGSALGVVYHVSLDVVKTTRVWGAGITGAAI